VRFEKDMLLPAVLLSVMENLQCVRKFISYPGNDVYPVSLSITVLPVAMMTDLMTV